VPPQTPSSPSARPGSTRRAVRTWILGSFAGRAVATGALVKLAALLLGLAAVSSSVVEIIDAIGDVSLVAGALALGYQAYARVRSRLLWRVRQRLILSYVFIGVVPLLLVAAFFALAGLLFFFNVSAFVLRGQMDGLVESAHLQARSLAGTLAAAPDATTLGRLLAVRQTAEASGDPLLSYAVVPDGRPCGTAARREPVRVTAGPWGHVDAPTAVPSWVPCDGYAGLVAYAAGGRRRVVARALERVPGYASALVVDMPIGEAVLREIHEDTGLTVTDMTLGDEPGAGLVAVAAPAGAADAGGTLDLGPLSFNVDAPREPLRWWALPAVTEWESGAGGTLTMRFSLGAAALSRYFAGASSGSSLFGFLLVVIGGLFLVILGVAFFMGIGQARSVTGAVHELFVGTERVQRGDFSHRIALRSRDQLAELAESFNSMTASIEDLLRAKAEKERLEQELRVARSIQMSLLPQGPLRVPGLSLAGHCEPAREVGGDYYDFLPLDDGRLGILIADVAGKGTSAALYMAELKGLMLSLSQLHVSPRRLLIDANRIISRHLDVRSFITMTYAVADPAAGTITCARAGHCPLVYVPGPHAVSRAPQTLVPDGMVLGLALDTGDMFDRVLEEITLPLGHGDLFLLYTDGISEAMNDAGDCYGDTRLAEVAARHADLASDDLREHILRDVRAFTGEATQHDDMTMVLLKVEALS
jgi:serine phosphatase RsbU (regulator of sigma subunit)